LCIYIVLIVFLISIFTSLVEAEVNIVFDKEISDGYSFELNNTNYNIYIGENNHSAIKLKSSGNINKTIILAESDCYTIGYEKFCYHSYEDEKKILASLIDKKPVIEVTRKVSNSKIDLGKNTTVEIIFENTGGTDVTDFYFREVIPKEFSILSKEGCDEDEDNVITIDSKLRIDETRTCLYTIRGDSVYSSSYQGNVTTLKLASLSDLEDIPKVSITTKSPIKYSFVISKTNLSAFEPFTLSMNFTNDKTQKEKHLILDDVTIHLDDDFLIYKNAISDLRKSADAAHIRRDIPYKKSIQESLMLTPLLDEGKLTLEIEVTFRFDEVKDENGEKTTIEGESFTFLEKIPINLSYKPMICSFIYDDDPTDKVAINQIEKIIPHVLGGNIGVLIENINPYLNFEQIRPYHKGNLKFSSNSLTRNLKHDSKKVLSLTPYYYKDNSTNKYDLDVDVKYKTPTGKIQVTFCNAKFSVQPSGQFNILGEVNYPGLILNDISLNYTYLSLLFNNTFPRPANNIATIISVLNKTISMPKNYISIGINESREFNLTIPSEIFNNISTNETDISINITYNINSVDRTKHLSIPFNISKAVFKQNAGNIQSDLEKNISINVNAAINTTNTSSVENDVHNISNQDLTNSSIIKEKNNSFDSIDLSSILIWLVIIISIVLLTQYQRIILYFIGPKNKSSKKNEESKNNFQNTDRNIITSQSIQENVSTKCPNCLSQLTIPLDKVTSTEFEKGILISVNCPICKTQFNIKK